MFEGNLVSYSFLFREVVIFCMREGYYRIGSECLLNDYWLDDNVGIG